MDQRGPDSVFSKDVHASEAVYPALLDVRCRSFRDHIEESTEPQVLVVPATDLLSRFDEDTDGLPALLASPQPTQPPRGSKGVKQNCC